MSSSLKFAMIGAGEVASVHADVLTALGHSIKAVAAKKGSPRLIPFAEKYHVPHLYDKWTALLEEESCAYDALVVATSWDQTESIIEKIVSLNLPCLVEKPVALSSSGIMRIIKASKNKVPPLMVAYNRRFYDFIPRLREQLTYVQPISIDLNCPEVVSLITARYGVAILPHILIYMTSHWLDLLLYLVGDLEILHIQRTWHPSREYVIAYDGVLRPKGGSTMIHLKIHFDAPARTALTFTFPDSIWHLSPIEQLTIYKGMRDIAPTQTTPYRRYEPHVVDCIQVDSKFKPGYYRQMQDFIETCVRRHEPSQVGCNLTDALRCTQLCEQIKGGEKHVD